MKLATAGTELTIRNFCKKCKVKQSQQWEDQYLQQVLQEYKLNLERVDTIDVYKVIF
jgi:hypothetical protein